MPIILSKKAGGGGGGSPSGPAGGDLSGTYPNPTINAQSSVDGAVLTSDGANATDFELPPGYEYEYQQITANVNVSATVEGSADTIITADSVTFDGSTPVYIIFYSQLVRTASGVDNQQVVLNLFEDGSDVGRIAQIRGGAVGGGGNAEGSAVYAAVRRTPANGSRTYSVRGWVTAAGTAVVQAGAGGSGTSVPAFLRIVKA